MIDLSKEVKELIKSHPHSYNNLLEKKEYSPLKEFINSKVPGEYRDRKWSFKCYVALYGVPVCKVCGERLTGDFLNHVSIARKSYNCPKCKLKQTDAEKGERFAKCEKDPVKREKILNTYKIYYNKDKLKEWALNFRSGKGRRPTKTDFEEFFGREFPRKGGFFKDFDFTVFDLWDSYLELKVCDYLKNIGYSEKRVIEDCTDCCDFMRNKLFTAKDESKFQVDIYFPYFKFGLEIQDFTTHDRYSDTAIYKQRRKREYKKGPTYSLNKKNKAAELGITISELWEDDIRSNRFKEEINLCLNQII